MGEILGSCACQRCVTSIFGVYLCRVDLLLRLPPLLDLIDSPVVSIDSEASVEDACEVRKQLLGCQTCAERLCKALLSKNLPCIAINGTPTNSPHDIPFLGLFDVRALMNIYYKHYS